MRANLDICIRDECATSLSNSCIDQQFRGMGSNSKVTWRREAESGQRVTTIHKYIDIGTESSEIGHAFKSAVSESRHSALKQMYLLEKRENPSPALDDSQHQSRFRIRNTHEFPAA